MISEEIDKPVYIDALRRKAEQVVAGRHQNRVELSQDEVLELMSGLLGRITELVDRNGEFHHELESLKSLNSRAVDSLQINNDYFRSVVQTTNDAIISANKLGDIVLWNKAATTMFGYTQDEIIGKSITTITPERFRSRHLKGFERVVSTGKTRIIGKTVEMTGVKKDGDEFPIELSLSMWESEGAVFFTSIIRDISERKYSEAEMRSLAAFPGENRNPVMRVSKDGLILYANESSDPILSFWDRKVGQQLPDKWCLLINDVMSTAESHTTYASCEERIYSLNIVPVEESSYLNIYGEDVTDRKRAEVLIKQQNQFITTVFDSIRDPLYVVDVNDYTIQMSNHAAQLDDSIASATCYSINHHQNRPCSQMGNQCPLEDLKITKRPAIAEHIHYDSDGKQRFVEVHVHPILNNQGEVIQAIEYLIDITDRKQMELALSESEEKWRSLTQKSPDHIVMLDTDLKIKYFNYPSPGLSPDELIGVPIWKLVEEGRKSEIKGILEQVLITGEPDRYETQYIVPDGDTIYYESHVVPYKVDNNLIGLVLSARDITERKQMEVVLRERTHALGERVKELSCLYSIAALVEKPDITLAEILQGTIDLIPPSWQYPELTGARLILGEHVYKTESFAEGSPWVQAAEIVAHGQREGRLEICYLERMAERDEGPFLKEERSLINAIAGRLGRIVERIQAEEALQKAHTELELRVLERTAELEKANQALQIEITERKRAHKAEQYARKTAEILQDASQALSQTLDLTTVMELFLDHAYQLVPYRQARVFLFEDESHLSIRAERGSGTLETQTSIQIDTADDPIIHKLLNQQKSILIPDTKSDSRSLPPKLTWKSARSWMGIPLITEKKAIGISIFEDTESMAFSEHQLQLLDVLAGLVTVNIQNAWLFEQVRSGRERLQSLSRRLVEVQESERRYISRELHDEASQALASMKVGLRLIERDAHNPESVIAGAVDLKNIADGVIENLYRLAMDLRPFSLDHLGLVAALEQYTEAISDRHKLSLQYEATGLDERLAPDTETAIYRIVQEALSNVILHAQATRADILLEKRGQNVTVIIEDNGIGFDPRNALRSGRLGLVGIQERAEMLGGSFIVESQPGVGTTLFLEVPDGD